MKPLNTEIQEAIKKHLSSEVGDVLKQRLEEADSLEKKVADLEYKCKIQQDDISRLNELVNKHSEITVRENKIFEREGEVSQREFLLDVHDLTLKLEEANKRSELVVGFTQSIFRNTEIRKGIFSGDTTNVLNPQGYITPVNNTKTYNETEEKL